MVHSLDPHRSDGRSRTTQFTPEHPRRSARIAALRSGQPNPTTTTSSYASSESEPVNVPPEHQAPYATAFALIQPDLDPSFGWQTTHPMTRLSRAERVQRMQTGMLEEGDIAYVFASLDVAYASRAALMHGSTSGAGGEDGGPILQANTGEFGNANRDFRGDFTQSTMTVSSSYPKSGRPAIVIKKDFPEPGAYVVAPMATYGGKEVHDLDDLAHAFSHRIASDGMIPPHSWRFELEEGELMVANHAIMIPGFPPRMVAQRSLTQYVSVGTPIVITAEDIDGVNPIRVHPKVVEYVGMRMRLLLNDETADYLGLPKIVTEEEEDADDFLKTNL